MARHVPTLSNRALTVLAHLLDDPDADHVPAEMARAIGMSEKNTIHVITLLATHGWVVRHESTVALTPLGKIAGRAAVSGYGPPVPLQRLDTEDPTLADRARAVMGWAPRHGG